VNALGGEIGLISEKGQDSEFFDSPDRTKSGYRGGTESSRENLYNFAARNA